MNFSGAKFQQSQFDLYIRAEGRVQILCRYFPSNTGGKLIVYILLLGYHNNLMALQSPARAWKTRFHLYVFNRFSFQYFNT